MKDRLLAWAPLLPLLLLLAATYWLNKQVQPVTPGSNPNLRHDADYVINNFTATSLDEQGKPRFIISAQKMWHFPDDDSTHLDAPQLLSMLPGSPPMRSSALRGELSSKGDEVYLYDDVTIFRPAYGQQSAMTFTTSYLHATPDKNTADTDRQVVLTNANTHMQAVGMELNNATRTVRLLSRVKSTYDPGKK